MKIKKSAKSRMVYAVAACLCFSMMLACMNVSAADVAMMALEGATPDDNWKTVIGFFTKWIARIGGVVGLVGAVMFGLSIKNNDAEQKQSGLLTMVAGFAVAGIATMANSFGIFD